MRNSGAWKIWHVSPHDSTKRGGNKAESIPVHMRQGQTATKNMKDKGEIITVTVHAVQINKTKTLFLPTEEDWRQATSEDHDLICINRIVSSPD